MLVIDMFNTYRHQDGEQLTPTVAEILDPLVALIERVRCRDDVDLIYVNENYGDFTAEFDDIVGAALEGLRPDLVEPLTPGDDCLKLTKVRHSAFFSTPLHYLLDRRSTQRLVLTGQVTEQCILYTALDAYVRHYSIVVAVDAVANIDPGLGKAALLMMSKNMGATLVAAKDCLN